MWSEHLILELVQELTSLKSAQRDAAPAAVTGRERRSGTSGRMGTNDADTSCAIKVWTNWKFLEAGVYSVATVASTATAAKPANLKYWDFKTFFIIEPPCRQTRNPYQHLSSTTRSKASKFLMSAEGHPRGE